MKYCNFCREENADDAMFCQKCGSIFTTVQDPVIPSQPEKENIFKRLVSFWKSGFRGKAAIGCGTILIIMIACVVFLEIYTSSPEYQARATEHKSSTQTAQAAPTSTATQPPIPSDTPVPTATVEPLVALQHTIERNLGESNRDVARVSDLYWDEESAEITVIFTTNEQHPDTEIILAIMRDTFNVLDTLYHSGIENPYKNVNIVATYPIVDIYGNIIDEDFAKATYSRETLNKINWSNFDIDNIFEISNENQLFFHSLLWDIFYENY